MSEVRCQKLDYLYSVFCVSNTETTNPKELRECFDFAQQENEGIFLTR